ncbi:MAG: hypothetical protein NT070_10840 [Cyanobacteria bacterium]|nr:hypothetical protein [Cyanobacteriota bacterium]
MNRKIHRSHYPRSRALNPSFVLSVQVQVRPRILIKALPPAARPRPKEKRSKLNREPIVNR